MIKFDNVTRKYGKKIAVSSLKLEIPRGELFAFLGPNGAGKTTTIKMIVGLLRPTGGSITLCGLDVVKDRRQANRLLAYVPEMPFLYDKLSGREFLQFVVDMHALDPKTSEKQLEHQINIFEMSDFIDELTEGYSHGMKQRLTFAAALIHEPEILILDEPMVGLDPRSCRLVKDLLREKASQGMTIFMSTHSLSVAEEIADRIGIVNHGQVCFVGTLGDLREELSLRQTSLEELYLKLLDGTERAGEARDGVAKQPSVP